MWLRLLVCVVGVWTRASASGEVETVVNDAQQSRDATTRWKLFGRAAVQPGGFMLRPQYRNEVVEDEGSTLVRFDSKMRSEHTLHVSPSATIISPPMVVDELQARIEAGQMRGQVIFVGDNRGHVYGAIKEVDVTHHSSFFADTSRPVQFAGTLLTNGLAVTTVTTHSGHYMVGASVKEDACAMHRATLGLVKHAGLGAAIDKGAVLLRLSPTTFLALRGDPDDHDVVVGSTPGTDAAQHYDVTAAYFAEMLEDVYRRTSDDCSNPRDMLNPTEWAVEELTALGHLRKALEPLSDSEWTQQLVANAVAGGGLRSLIDAFKPFTSALSAYVADQEHGGDIDVAESVVRAVVEQSPCVCDKAAANAPVQPALLLYKALQQPMRPFPVKAKTDEACALAMARGLEEEG